MHPATVANVEILRQRDANFIGPEKGMLACGYEGIGVSGRSTKSSPKRLNTRSADAQHARQRKKIGGEINLLLFQQTTDLNYLAFYFLTALFFTGEAAFFATFLTGAFLAGAFIAGAGFLAAGLAEAFFAAGISYPPFHSAVAEDKKLISFQFA